ncbi:MAG: flagellar biosynthesis protein FlhA [Alphaproteobacteria bacterium]|nr:flagellar biosynthesis protein FlhA [Alphaproteobacteria bacterium]
MAEADAPAGRVITIAPNEILTRAKLFSRRGDLAFALGIVAILTTLVLPMPAWAMDFLLGISITLSVLILMTVLFIDKHLDLNAFPTILLIATVLRLALNIASTRLILSEGHTGTAAAGHVIEAFGSLVMQGSVVIGVIIFGILSIINFVVITKGSGRIAEVSARFSLDAMPGKQMAIDADLSAGLIDEGTAKARRKELEDESTFFGAMDGASKFVRGDAIAGLLITFINFIGGILIGVVQRDMSFSDALHTYTLLSIGDGLVSQIPALIVSTAAGLLVSKSGVSGSADKAVIGQLAKFPQALGMSSALTFVLALMPGIPAIPFLTLGTLAGVLAWLANRSQLRVAAEVAQAAAVEAEAKAGGAKPAVQEAMVEALSIDALRLELGYGLLPLINYQKGHRLTEQIKALRRQLARDYGFVMPAVRIQDNMQLPPNSYVIRVKEGEAARGDIRPDMLLAMDPTGGPISLPGEETKEPTFGLPAMWIGDTYREEALFRNYTVVDPPTVITTHLTEVIKDNMAELLSYSETQKLVEDLAKEHQKLVGDTVPSIVTVGTLQRILQNLLMEQVSIRDLPAILEAAAEAAKVTQNVVLVTEHVRARLARQISTQHTVEDGFIPIVTLSPPWEQAFAESLTGAGDERQLSMAPSRIQDFITAIRKTFDTLAMQGIMPVLLTSPGIRPYVRSIIERFRPSTIIISQNEIHPKAKIKNYGQVG